MIKLKKHSLTNSYRINNPCNQWSCQKYIADSLEAFFVHCFTTPFLPTKVCIPK